MPQVLETPYGEIEFDDDVSPEQMQEQYQRNLSAFQEQPQQEKPLTFVPPQIPRSLEELAMSNLQAQKEITATPLQLPEYREPGYEYVTPEEQAQIDLEQQQRETAPSIGLSKLSPWQHFRLSSAGQKLFGPTEPERAGMIGTKPGLLEIPQAMFQMTLPPPQISRPVEEAAEQLSRTGGPIGGVAAGAVRTAMGFASPAIPLVPFASLPRAARAAVAASVTGPYVNEFPEMVDAYKKAVNEGDYNKAAQIVTEAGLGGTVALLAPLGVLPKTKSPIERTPNAPTERPIQESVLSERPGIETQRQAVEAVPGNRLQPSEEVKAAQGEVALTPSEKAMKPPEAVPKMDMPPEELAAHTQTAQKLIDTVRQGGTEIKIEEAPRREYASDVMWTSTDGVVHVNVPRLETWIKEIGGKNLDKWMDSGLTHEVIHSNVFRFMEDPGNAMTEYFSNATKAEQLLAERAYYRKFGSGKIDPFQLGAEMFRRDMERLDGLKPTELVQSKGLEWVKQGFIDLLERGIKKTRETLGTKASKAQLDILNRYQERIDSVRKAKGWETPTQTTRMQPAEEVAKVKEEEKPRFTPADVDKMTSQQFMDSMKEIPDGLTGEAYRIGQNTKTPEALQELSSLRDKYSAESKAAMKVQDFDAAMSNSSRSQFYREAYEAATGTGSAGSWLRKSDPNYKPTMEGAEALRMEPKKEGEREPLPSGQFIRTKDGMEATIEKDTGGDTITVMRPSGRTETIPASEVWWDAVEPPTSPAQTPVAPAVTTTPPIGNPPSASAVAVSSPNIELVRKAKDFHIINNVNSPQWTFMFGRLGEAAKNAIERIFTGEFKMREGVGKDVRVYVEDALAALPRKIRKGGGKAFFDALNGKTIEQIRTEWEGNPGGEKVIAQAEKVKRRLEEIRTTIRDTKFESYRNSLEGMDRETLSELYVNNIGQDPALKTKSQMAQELAAMEYPEAWGISDGSYLPHLFFGGYKITASLPGQEGASFVSRAKTPSEAKAKIYELTNQNPEYDNAQFKVEQDTVIPADMIRLGDKRFWRMIRQMKDNLGVSAVEVKQAQQGIIGRKAAKQKWFGSLQERIGFEGYERDYKKIMTSYLSGFNRWKELSAMQKDVQPLIEQVRSEGRLNAASALDDIMENLWGKPARSTVEFDALVNRIPGLRDIVKPLALERWSRNIRSLTALMTLRTLRFATINRLQPLQGLYPIVGERILTKGKLMQHSPEGRALLDEAGVTYDVSQYGQEGGIVTKAKRLGERFSGERTNQELAFLSMFIHGTEQGMSRPEAIKYAKLRGQLMTQFTPLVSDIPPAFRGPFGQLAFQFKRFPIKQIELAANLAADKNIPGLVRMLAVFAVMGGVSYFMRQTYQSNEKKARLRRAFKEELGDKWADVAMYGLPGLLGADISGSIVLGEEPMGKNIYEKLGRQAVGPAASLLYETSKGIASETRQPTTITDKTKAIIRRIPSLRPLAEASDLITENVDVMTPDGEVKYRRALTDAIAGLGSFRTVNEADRQTTVSAIIELRKEQQQLQNALYVALKSGSDTDPQWEAIRNFNQRWPEVAMTTEEIKRYVDYRERGATKTDVERATGRKFAPLMPAQP